MISEMIQSARDKYAKATATAAPAAAPQEAAATATESATEAAAPAAGGIPKIAMVGAAALGAFLLLRKG